MKLCNALSWTCAAIAFTAANACGQSQGTLISSDNIASRNWTSSDGKFSVNGKLVAIEGDQISIRFDDGKNVSVPLGKISATDQAYVEGMRQGMASRAQSPFEEVTPNTKAESARGDSKADYSGLESIDLSSDVTVNLAGPNWKRPDRSKLRPVRIRRSSIHVRVQSVASNVNDSRLVVSFHDPFGDADDKEAPKNWVSLVDLKTAKVLREYPLLGDDVTASDISADGARLLSFSANHHNPSRIRIFQIGAQELALAQEWKLGEEVGFFKDVTSARFLADGSVVTELFDKLIVWQLNPLAARFQVEKNGDWTLAPDCRHALVGRHGSRFEVDLIEGKCTGADASAEVTDNAQASSPDGQKTASVDAWSVKIVNSTGDVQEHFYAPIHWPKASVAWVDDRFLLIEVPSRSIYVDTHNRVLLCEVIHHGGNQRDESGWRVSSGSQGIEITPSQAVRSEQPKLLDLAKRLPGERDALLVMKPGDDISLSVNLKSAPGQNNAVRQGLTKLLQGRQINVSDGAKSQMVASSDQTTEQVEYRSFGTPHWQKDATQSVNVTKTLTQLQLRVGDKVVWQISSSYGAGFVLMMQEGESAQQAANRESNARPDFWTTLDLPPQVAMHPNGRSWFSFSSTEAGLKPWNN